MVNEKAMEEKLKEALRKMESKETGSKVRAFICVQEALSLLRPEPCKECGGSGEVPIPVEFGHHHDTMEHTTCSHCKGTGEEPACSGDVGEFMKRCREAYKFSFSYDFENRDVRWLKEALDLLQAQAKANAYFESGLHRAEEMLNEYRIKIEQLEAKVERLEGALIYVRGGLEEAEGSLDERGAANEVNFDNYYKAADQALKESEAKDEE